MNQSRRKISTSVINVNIKLKLRDLQIIILNLSTRKSSTIVIYVNMKLQKMNICRFILYQFMKISSMFELM